MTSSLKPLSIEPVFLLSDEALLAAAAAVCPEMSTCFKAWRSTLPLPSRVRDTRAGRWQRFPESYRSVAWIFGDLQSCKGSLLVKGSEPTMQDFDQLVHWVSRSSFRSEPTFGHMPMADHLALREHKVPGALTLREALAEATTALTLASSSSSASWVRRYRRPTLAAPGCPAASVRFTASQCRREPRGEPVWGRMHHLRRRIERDERRGRQWFRGLRSREQ